MNRLRTRLRGHGGRAALAAVLTAALAVTGVVAATSPAAAGTRTDIYTRDNTADAGYEPGSANFWNSPDIKVCNTLSQCATTQNPVTGSNPSVWVTLRNHGPYGSGPAIGTLHVYSTTMGGAAQWNPTGVLSGGQWHYGDWTEIGTKDFPSWAPLPTGVFTVGIPWNDPAPAPGHYCILTRWVSDTDPMYLEGTSTIYNAQVNNNDAWINVNVASLVPGVPVIAPFAIGNVTQVATKNTLLFQDPTGMFTQLGGQLVVDLGPKLFEQWKEAGAQGTGIKVVGDTQIQIVEPRKATIGGLIVYPGDRPSVSLTFTAKASPDKPIALTVEQYGPDGMGDDQALIGGVEYDFTNGRDQK